MASDRLNEKIKNKLTALAVISNETRYNILVALLTSSVLKLGKHSHTFTELKQILDLKNPDLSYHLNNLKKADLVEKTEYPEGDKKVSYYSISSDGKKILTSLGLTESLIRDTRKKATRISN